MQARSPQWARGRGEGDTPAGGGGRDAYMGNACLSGFQNKNLMEKIIEMKVRELIKFL